MFALSTQEPMTLEQIGEDFGISREAGTAIAERSFIAAEEPAWDTNN